MINQPETQEQNPQQGKMILPGQSAQTPGNGLYRTPVQPTPLLRQTTPPTNPLARLGYFWHRDPAHKVLVIAVGMVLIAGLLFVSLVSGTMLRNPGFFALNSTFSQVPTVIVPAGTVELRPTFPPPGGGQGSSTSSQPPTQSTPALQPTNAPTVQPTQGGSLTVEITSIPGHVQNNSVVEVGVQTNQPGVSVTLFVRYDAPPKRTTAGPSVTDGSGNATISWSVFVFTPGGAQAMVVAIATDQNGQQVQSQPKFVQIGGFGGM